VIGRIRGILAGKQAPDILLDVGGVGYEVQVPMTTLYELPELGIEVSLFTHFVVREDAQLLFGFSTERERSLFRALIKVNGVGPKIGLAILSGLDAGQLVRVVQQKDTGSLVAVPGIGKRTAERILLDLEGKLNDWTVGDAPVAATSSQEPDIVAEAESALVALGYKPAEASRAVAAANDGSSSTPEELIRTTLRSMAG
jgi:Holliday junction DNA helicase RuvA